jgi:CMP-N,N'-diacetyllegionaminic acid synthase
MIHDKTVVAIIPARKGSQGVIGKNYKDICGRPLIEWSIQAAIDSSYIDQIVVSTNCLVCEGIVREMDNPSIRLIRRPNSLATATSKTEAAMEHALNQLEDTFDIVCLLQPTSPARKNRLIDRCLEQMLSEEADSAIAVSKHTPFFWKKGQQLWTDRPMRQQMTKDDFYFHDCGNFYAVEGALFKTYGRIGRKPALCETSDFESMQIDSMDDFRAMEALAGVYGGFL